MGLVSAKIAVTFKILRLVKMAGNVNNLVNAVFNEFLPDQLPAADDDIEHS
jgi:hypothetical protein